MDRILVPLAAAAAALGFAAPATAASLFLAFTPDESRIGPVSPEGCYTEAGPARGGLAPSASGSFCHTGLLGADSGAGIFAGDVPTETVAIFQSGPLSGPLEVGGPAVLVAHVFSGSQVGGVAAGLTAFTYALREKHAAGHFTTIVAGSQGNASTGHARLEIRLDVPNYALSADSRLQVLLGSGAPEARVIFGDQTQAGAAAKSYADSGITLTTNGPDRAGMPGGATGALLWPFVAMVLLRGRWRTTRQRDP